MTILEEENKVKSEASVSGQTAPQHNNPSSTPGSLLAANHSSSTLTASAATAASVVANSGSPKASEVVTTSGVAASVAAAAAGKNQYLSTMISNVADRYITPEYLAPLPPTEKTGKSPLQLLAQTCSQIGADPGSNKISLDNKTKEGKNKAGSPALIVSDNTSPNTGHTTQVNHRPFSFKPYETADSSSNRKKANKTPSSVISLSPSSNNNTTESSRSPPKSSTSTSSTSTTSSSSSSSSEATPVIRSGMEVLAGHPKDLPLGLYANPAFRPPLAASGGGGGAAGYPASLVPPTSLAASLAAAAAGSLGAAGSTGVCRDPYCRDPTCPTAVYNAQLMASLMASGLPPGYAELFQAHKTSAAAAANGAGPYICNWMNGREGYCGKRHSSAEELLQHLRTHTNLSTSDSAMYSASAAAAANFQRTYGSALSSMSAASRFHPYAAAVAAATAAKSSALPPSLSALGSVPPPLPTGLPPSLYSPAAASSLYASLYGSRLAGSLP